MSELELFGEELVDFIEKTDLQKIPEFFYDTLLNYLGVTYLGASHPAITVVINTLLEDHQGAYQPFNRKENLSLADVTLIDCFSSAVYAYDDIHFETTTHPCGIVISAILAFARKEQLSINETLNALYIGMETECRLATVMFDKKAESKSGWYTCGIVGGLAVAAALSHLYKFDRKKIKSALALASNYASGIRGSHGSMAGSFIPAIACKNGFIATMLVKNGMTCSFASLVGENGLIKQIAAKPALQKARKGQLSLNTSCKPYPYGFISFSAIALLLKIDIDYRIIDKIIVEVSSRVKNLGSNFSPQNMYDGLVSLPYIIGHILVDRKNGYLPLNSNFIITDDEQEIINKIVIKENSKLSDDEIYISINDKKYYLKDAPGSVNHPMTHDEVIDKFKTITDIKNKEEFIEKLYHQDITDIYQFIIEYFL